MKARGLDLVAEMMKKQEGSHRVMLVVYKVQMEFYYARGKNACVEIGRRRRKILETWRNRDNDGLKWVLGSCRAT